MDRFFDEMARVLATPSTRRSTVKAALGLLIAALPLAACVTPSSPSDNGGGTSNGGGGGSSCHCNPGNTYNFLTGVCCPSTSPYYYPGTHGGSRGCYASCPYIGDCGSSFQHC